MIPLPITLNPRSREVSYDGRRVRLQEQPFVILSALLERPGEVVGREELATRLWPDGTEVDIEHGLNAAVKRLRATLADNVTTPRFIETVPRRGYRLRIEIPPTPSALPRHDGVGTAPITIALVVWSEAAGVQVVPLSASAGPTMSDVSARVTRPSFMTARCFKRRRVDVPPGCGP